MNETNQTHDWGGAESLLEKNEAEDLDKVDDEAYIADDVQKNFET